MSKCQMNSRTVKSNWAILAKRAVNIDKCLALLQNPCEESLLPLAKHLCQLRRQFSQSNQMLCEFINEHNGLDLLFDILRKSEFVAQPSFVWAYLQLEVINCLRVIMESPLGIEKIISPNDEYADKLATGMSSKQFRTIYVRSRIVCVCICVNYTTIYHFNKSFFETQYNSHIHIV